MDLLSVYILLATILATITTIISILFQKTVLNHPDHLPPSPPSLPVVGHLHLLSLPLHRTLSRLSQFYGPSLLFLRFGSRLVLIISSPSAVEECFTKHDITFANRPRLPHGKHISYNYTALAAASYGPLLRDLRRIIITQIFSASRIRSMGAIRQEEIRLMVKVLFSDSCKSTTNSSGIDRLVLGGLCQQDHSFNYNLKEVDMKVVFSELMFNVIMKIIAGKRYFGVNVESEPEEGKRFRDMVEDLFLTVDAASPEDFLPFLKWFGFNKSAQRSVKLRKDIDPVFQGLIDDRRRKRGGKKEKEEEEGESTVIDVLLSLQEKEGGYYNDELIMGTILTLIAAGTHTSSAALEWGMSLLLNHPHTLQKVKDEIDNQVGHERLINHSDLPNLSYLNNVIKETLRMYPTVPLLLPHESSKDCTVQGFHIPTDTIMFTNIYSLHRDPELWAEPEMFKPERFEDNALNGSKYIYFPFGLGRRSCPGEGLALQIVSLGLGALIQCFEWERISEVQVDMTEGAGIAMPKERPLVARYRPRKVILDVLNRL